jgi:hypothetical protein
LFRSQARVSSSGMAPRDAARAAPAALAIATGAAAIGNATVAGGAAVSPTGDPQNRHVLRNSTSASQTRHRTFARTVASGLLEVGTFVVSAVSRPSLSAN